MMKTKNLTKKFIKAWLLLATGIFSLSLNSNVTYANEEIPVDWFNIIPKLSDAGIADANEQINKIWVVWWEVRENYNDVASKIDTSEQIASWIMNRDTIMNYLVFVVQFLSQLGLLVWTGFIMYAWYKYMLSVFDSGKWATKGPIINAIIWIIIIIFSFAILKTFTSFIGIS